MNYRLAAAAFILVSSVSAASAQAPAVNWSGFYIGGYAGYAWGNTKTNGAADCPAGRNGYFCLGSNPVSPRNQLEVNNQIPGNASPSHFIWGAFTGHNWQSGNWVIGAEADFGSFKLGTSRSGSGPYPTESDIAPVTFTVNSSTNTDWLLTGRGRLGWAMSNVLFYTTGGIAITRAKLSTSFKDNISIENPILFRDGSGSGANTQTLVGYVLGGGVEWKVSQNWTARGEYLFMDFGRSGVNMAVTNPTGPGRSNLIWTSTDLSAQVLRFGISYSFN